jgi:hypothetical protein
MTPEAPDPPKVEAVKQEAVTEEPEVVVDPVEPPTIKEPAPAAAPKKVVKPKVNKPKPKEDPTWDPNSPFLPQ